MAYELIYRGEDGRPVVEKFETATNALARMSQLQADPAYTDIFPTNDAGDDLDLLDLERLAISEGTP